MTRINTNVSSLIAQKTLARSNAELEQSLQRLSTGLKINSGKDDPAGLIASEILRSDIAATNVAISNCERANQMISTADSSLAEVGNLLIEIRSLVSEAANDGAMSADQIAANQLQVDSSLAAIDRIAQVTQFQGNRLLDGSLDFVTENVNSSMLSDVQVHQANFGTLSEMNVEVDVVTQATQAELTYQSNTVGEDLIMTVAGNTGSTNFSFAAGTTVDDMAAAINMVSDALGVTAEVDNVVATEDMKGVLGLGGTSATTSAVSITAATAGKDAGNYALRYVLGGTGLASGVVMGNSIAATLDSGTKLLDVKIKSTGWDVAKGTKTTTGFLTASVSNKLYAANKGAGYDGMKVKLVMASFTTGASTKISSVNIKQSGASDTWTISFNVQRNGAGATLGAAAFKNAFNAVLGTAGMDWLSLNAVGGAVSSANVGTANAILFTLTGGQDDQINATAPTYALLSNAIANYTTGGATAADPFNASVTGGAGVIQEILSQSAYHGSINSSATSTASDEPNNYIQFLSPDGMANIEINFVTSGLDSSLEIAGVDNLATGGKSTAYYQGTDANTSFKIEAVNQGTAYDGTKIQFQQQTTGVTGTNAIWDKENDAIIIQGDFATGVAVADIETAINNNAGISAAFTFSDIGTGAGTITGVYTTAQTVATTDGGNQYESITITLGTSNGQVTSTAADVISAVNSSTLMQGLGISASNAFGSDGTGLVSAGSTRFDAAGARASTGTATGTTTAANGEDAAIRVTAKNSGDAYDNVQIVFENQASAGSEYVEWDAGTKKLTIHASSGNSTASAVINSLANNPLSATAANLFSMSAVGDGTAAVTSSDTGYTSGGSFIATETAITAGSTGGIHILGNADEGDILGSRGLNIKSTGYGANAFVSVKGSPQDTSQTLTFAMIDENSNTATRATGADADVRINGAEAVSDGLDISIYTATLNLDFTLDSSLVDNSNTTFRITGGGAQFQIGPDVISTQQARMGIPSINATELGGVSGRMYQLQSGNTAALDTNTTLAASIVEEAITQVTSLRGRLGAFQATTLETTIETLTSAVENLTAAESSIRDTDFASESSAMTRAQILVSSGMTVLSIANQQPQNVLQLLQ